jgi:hypothetical protein
MISCGDWAGQLEEDPTAHVLETSSTAVAGFSPIKTNCELRTTIPIMKTVNLGNLI